MQTHAHVCTYTQASCIPAIVLDPPPGSSVIDACAAPGNKTTHLAAIMGDTGCVQVSVCACVMHMAYISCSHIVAFDRDAKRFKTLENMVSKAGANCITVQLADFLQVRSHHDMMLH